MSAKIRAVSLTPVGGTADEFAATLRRDADRWATTARTAGVKGE